jgi:hypothetical protein
MKSTAPPPPPLLPICTVATAVKDGLLSIPVDYLNYLDVIGLLIPNLCFSYMDEL